MTVSVSFEAAQIQVNNGSTGVQLSQVILPYSIRNSEDSTKYLGGQMTLFPSDGIKLTDNTNDWNHLALAKIKNMVADAEIYLPDDEPAQSEAPVEDVPVSESPQSEVTNEDKPVSETDEGELTLEE